MIDSVNNGNQSAIILLNDKHQIALELGGDVEAQLAAMVLVYANENEERADQARDATEDMIRDAGDKQVSELRQQADDIRSGGFVAALGGVLGGAATVGSGIHGVTQIDLSSSEAVLDKVGSVQKVIEGTGTVVDALGQGGAAAYQGAASHHEANATAADNDAAAAERRLDEINDDIDKARDLYNDVLDFLESVNQSQAATNQSVIYRG
jgi:hypothetical protein